MHPLMVVCLAAALAGAGSSVVEAVGPDSAPDPTDTPNALTYLGQRDPVDFTVPACPMASIPPTEPPTTKTPAPLMNLRVASFDTSLSRSAEGELVADLSSPDDPQAAAVAEILQRTRPDVVLLGGFDLDADDEAVRLFREHYLGVAQHEAEPIDYPYWFTAEVNTGEQSGFDLDRDGTVGGPGDAFGLGEFPGQHGMVILSRYPILSDEVRTYQHLLWASMPDARLPDNPATPEPGDWYSVEELAVLRLASTSHWDVPIDVDGEVVHLLASAPAAPGPGEIGAPATLRNADEIRFWAEYVAGDDNDWIVDDNGVTGGLDGDAEFAIVGDLNADPVDGNSVDGAIQQLLDLEMVHDPAPRTDGGAEASEVQGGANTTHQGDPGLDTADLTDDPGPGNLRTDYVLASSGLDVVDAAVFWPTSDDPLATLVASEPTLSSQHRLVWVDLHIATAVPDVPPPSSAPATSAPTPTAAPTSAPSTLPPTSTSTSSTTPPTTVPPTPPPTPTTTTTSPDAALAVDDFVQVVVGSEGTTVNVLANDRLGTPPASLVTDEVNFPLDETFPLGGPLNFYAGVMLRSDGLFLVYPVQANPGDGYTLMYSLAQPGHTSTATIHIGFIAPVETVPSSEPASSLASTEPT
jgi:hypothetical protein